MLNAPHQIPAYRPPARNLSFVGLPIDYTLEYTVKPYIFKRDKGEVSYPCTCNRSIAVGAALSSLRIGPSVSSV